MKKALVSGFAAIALLAAGSGIASADQNGDPNAFICPVVGAGVLNSPKLDAHLFGFGDAATFLPGKEQAGRHANANGLNANGTPSPTNLPGAEGFTPIWNPAD
jgi:hypothetical protein